MWLLLAAAGTGYLARCWQKSRKRKSGLNVFKHNKAISSSSQRSPSCTPRSGRSTNASRHGSRKRSQSAKSRKLLSRKSEGRLARNCAMDWDENSGSPEKLFEESLHGDDESTGQCLVSVLKNLDTFGQVQSCSQVNISHGNNQKETYLSLSSMCAQDQWRDASSCMEQPPLLTADIDAREPLFCIGGLSNTKPIFETLHGCSAATLDFVKTQFSMGASCSKNRIDSSEPVENSFIASNGKSRASPAYVQIPRIKTVRENRTQNCVYESKASTEQAFGLFAKMARELGQRTCSTFTAKYLSRMRRGSCWKSGSLQDPHKVSVCQSLSYGNLWKEIPKKEKDFSLQMDECELNSCILHSHLLKALLDPEYLDQSRKCDYLTVSIRGSNLQNAAPCSTYHAGLSMASDRETIQSPDSESITNYWKHSKGQATAFTNPPDSSINQSLGSNESSSFALGVAMGAAFVASSRNNEFEDLHKLLYRTNLLMEELKRQIDSKFEFDLVKLINAKKYNDSVPLKPTMPELICPWKAHQHSESNPGTEISSLELFNAVNNHASNVLADGHLHGLNELEAELEAELQLLERNVCTTNLVDYDWKQTDSKQESSQPEGNDDGLYVDVDVRDSMAAQDVEPLYESDFVVPPLELERRLWQVLEQRHEERIGELENDLHITNEKVAAKELEVQWWKDRVWWLMETSLGEKE